MFSFLSRAPADTAQVDALFSEAFACIEQGLCYDEIDDWENTVGMYERGLNLIREAEKAKNAKKSELYANLLEAKKSVENRVIVLKKEGPKKVTNEVVVPSSSQCTKESEMKSSIRQDLDAVGAEEADLVYFLPGGVQLFTIDGDDTTAPTYPTSLQIFRFAGSELTPGEKEEAAEMTPSTPSAMIQVGPWVYPLIKGQTPVLRNEYGAFVVPNPTVDHPNMMVAIMISSDTEPRLIDEFKIVLNQYALLREQDVKPELTSDEQQRLSHRIARFLMTSGDRIAWGVQTATVRAASKVELNGERYRSGLEPTATPMAVNPAIHGSIVYMHKGTKVVGKCTRYLLDKIGDIGISVGQKLASGAQSTFGEGKAGGLVSGTIAVLGGGIAGASTVWMSLENGSKTLCRSIANETVQNVKVKYGDDASSTTHHALFAAGHGSLAAMQLWDLGPRSVAGRMARKAGIQVVSDLHQKSHGPLPIKKPM